MGWLCAKQRDFRQLLLHSCSSHNRSSSGRRPQPLACVGAAGRPEKGPFGRSLEKHETEIQI